MVASHAPSLPPVRLTAPDGSTTLNLRMRRSTIAALTNEARARGLTIKQVVANGLRAVDSMWQRTISKIGHHGVGTYDRRYVKT